MSFTKAQDLTDTAAMKGKLEDVRDNRGTRNEARSLTEWATEKATVEGRSPKNDKRLGIDYMQEMIDAGNDQLAVDHCTNLTTILNSVTV
jgi:hypothetical protein